MRPAAVVIKQLKELGLSIVTVESCSGGALVSALTDIPGASEVVKGAYVTYCNAAKVALGVPQEIIDRYTVYSPTCAEWMALAAATRQEGLATDIAVSVTGSLNTVDPKNTKNSEPGKVYACFHYNNRNTPIPHFCRHEVQNKVFFIPEYLNRVLAKEFLVRSLLSWVNACLVEIKRTKDTGPVLAATQHQVLDTRKD